METKTLVVNGIPRQVLVDSDTLLVDVLRNQRQITIKVNPEMVGVVKERLKGLLTEFPSLAYVDVAEDPHLGATACVVETEAGLVEASVEGQIAAIEKSIRSNFAKEK